MGTKKYCDCCMKEVPNVKGQLEGIMVGDELIGEACVICRQHVRTALVNLKHNLKPKAPEQKDEANPDGTASVLPAKPAQPAPVEKTAAKPKET